LVVLIVAAVLLHVKREEFKVSAASIVEASNAAKINGDEAPRDLKNDVGFKREVGQ
jgi:hypothetical protein